MKKYLRKFLLFITQLIFVLFGLTFLADGNSDDFYLKFTSPPQKNIILGTSRALQGIQPREFKDILGIDIYNYAFTVKYSPYGKVYYESLLKKHSKEKNAVFILSIDPWAICSDSKDVNDMKLFRENNGPLADIHFVNCKPNLEYIFKYFKGRYKYIILDSSKYLFLHDDGWLEVSNLPSDSTSYHGRIERTLNAFKDSKPQLSDVRLSYLIKTINYLKDYGSVYLVRLPVHPEMAKIDNKILPDFDTVISEAIALSDGYYDMSDQNNEYLYNDSNHLHKDSGAQVSRKIANWIKLQQSRN